MTIYSGFAIILDYPNGHIAEVIRDCTRDLAVVAPDAHEQMLAFQAAVQQKSLSQLQELYTSAFDLRPDCTPNLGHHLFGDDARRGVFLAELKGRMEARGMDLGIELPDHIALILQYLDLAEEERLPVIEDCLLPAVTKMIEALNNSGNAYAYALHALNHLLRHQHETLAAPADMVDA